MKNEFLLVSKVYYDVLHHKIGRIISISQNYISVCSKAPRKEQVEITKEYWEALKMVVFL